MIQDIYTLSPLQKGMYYNWLVNKESPVNFEQFNYQITGDLDASMLEKSFKEIIQRHDALRTSFTDEFNDNVLQIVKTEVSTPFYFKDVSNDSRFSIADFLNADKKKGFDLSNESQIRLQVFYLGDNKYEFIWSFHHIIMDGWCLGILIGEIYKLLNSYREQMPLNLSKPKPYSSYIKWLETTNSNSSLNYWNNYLTGYSTIAGIPFKRYSKENVYKQSKETKIISGELYSKIDQVCGRIGITKNTFMQCVWGFLLSKYNSTKDVVFGSVVSGRPAEVDGIEDMIGLFINTIPVRINYTDVETVSDLLKKTQAEGIASTPHHYMNLSEVQAQSELGMNLLNHIMVFENYPVQHAIEETIQNSQGAQEQKITIESVNIFEQTNYDFNITINPLPSSLLIDVDYNANIYEEECLKKLINHFYKLTEQFCLDIERPLRTIDYLSEEEKTQLLFEFNTSDGSVAKDKTIIDLFEEQVTNTPKNIAVVFEGKRLTYAELNEQANQLGRYLRACYSVQPNDLIGIKLGRSEKMIVAVLGILKSGAAYVPIDSAYPEERVQYIEQNSESKVIIDDTELEKFSQVQGDYSKDNLKKNNRPTDLAYVIYTSGTTGNPKGVMVEHRNVVSIFESWRMQYALDKMDVKLLQLASISFDVFVGDVCRSLLNGGKMIICSADVKVNPEQLFELISEQKISILEGTPGLLLPLMNYIDKEKKEYGFLKTVIFGSDAFNNQDYNKLKNKFGGHIRIVNSYGVTEATIDSTYYDDYKDELHGSTPIGKPFSNTQIYILGETLELVPIGVMGKIYIAGAGVARGYLNNHKLTEKKFISNPFSIGEKMYDTGDGGRWLSDGNIEFLRRRDNQVKIRGFRIELEEIETALVRYSEHIKQVVVEAKEVNEEKALVAYYVSDRDIDKSALRAFIQNKLPDYMIPGFYIALEQLPLTPNGKIDRRNLPEISSGDIVRKKYVSPRNELEQKIATIWQEVLRIEKIGITDNFFELGGHSLLVAQVINRMHKQLNKIITFKAFFESPTIEVLGKELETDKYIPIPKVPDASSYEVTASQSRLWLLSQLAGGSLAYNMPSAIKLTGSMDINKFERSFRLLIERHEILRTYFKVNEEGVVHQFIIPFKQVNFNIIREDFSSFENQEQAIENYLLKINAKAFNLEEAPLLRASLIKQKSNAYVFFLALHHIIGDGWSSILLINEVIEIYNTLIQNKEVQLPKLEIQYRDYAAWLKTNLQQKDQLISEKYWLNQFAGELPMLELPSFKLRPLVRTYNGAGLIHQFSKPFLEKLKELSYQQDVTLFMILMAGVKMLLYRYTMQDDIIIGTPIAGRDHPDLEDQMGLFLNTLAIRTKIDDDDTFLTLIEKEKQNLLDAYQHQHYPFDTLVNKLNLKRDTSRSALFDVLVILQTQGQLNAKKEGLVDLEVSNYDLKTNSSQFDLSFTFAEADCLSLFISYNTDIYDVYLIKRMFAHFENLILAGLEQPEYKIHTLQYITPAEKQQLLLEFNDNNTPYPVTKTIVDLFEEQVRLTPSAIAIVFEEIELSYQELNEKSNQLAHYFKDNYAIERNDLIGIKLERSERMMIAILGILKSGAAYVPIDPTYPKERIEYIEKDSDCKIVLTEEVLQEFLKVQNNYSTNNIDKINQLNDLAYVIYTSGTTGNPKGVMIEHRNAVELINWSNKEFDPSAFDVLYAVTSYCFDLSVYEFFYTLTTGKKMRVLKNALEIRNYIEKDKKILLNTVPSVVRKLQEEGVSLNNVSFINMSGEMLPVDVVKKLPTGKIEVRNLYGPTEDTVYSTSYLIKSVDYKSILIGKPLSNTQAYILDDQLQPVAIGVKGKLYLSGAGVARGYFNKPELTLEKFIPNPFIKDGRMYDTGDMVCWLPTGNIEFFGRKDFQVKVRGYRIELGEIEHVLSNYSEYLTQVIIAPKENNGEQVLVAYMVSSKEIDKSELRMYLQNKLPSYMIPGFYVSLASFPLTPNGKIDRKALPGISGNDLIRKEYVAPRTKIEISLVKIWEEILELDKVGVTDDFFELGGNSMKIVNVQAKIKQALNVYIPISDFFDFPFIEKIASNLEKQEVVVKEESKSAENANVSYIEI